MKLRASAGRRPIPKGSQQLTIVLVTEVVSCMSLSERVQQRLSELGISRLEATRRMNARASALGLPKVSAEFVRDIVSGRKSSVRGDNLRLLADALERDANWFLGLDEGAPIEHPAPFIRLRQLLELPIVGRVESNRWFNPNKETLGPSARASIYAAPVRGFEPQTLRAYELVDGSGGSEYPQGCDLIVSIASLSEASDGDDVIVRRETRAGTGTLIEISVRRLCFDEGRWTLLSLALTEEEPWALDPRDPTAPEVVGIVAAAQIQRPRRTRLDDEG